LIIKQDDASNATTARIREVELENARLRKLVVDLLLEKVRLEEKLMKPKGLR